MDWYASRPLGSTANVGDVQWCHLVANPGYSETRRKRYSTDSQNCSPPSSESTGPPGSPQEEGASSGDHSHQPIPQYHHAHVFHPPAAAAAYVYPGYLFGPAVYSVNGVPFPSVHPLHGISQSIHVHPSAAASAPPQGAVPAAPGSDGGSQRRRKKKRRRKRRRGLTDEASEETSSGEEEGGACGGEEFDGEDGTVVVVRLGNVMNQPQTGSSPPYGEGEGRGEAEASSTDCSELSGQPESSSGAEESVPAGELEDRGTQVEDGMSKGVSTRDAEVSAQGDLLLPEVEAEKEVSAETKEVWTQSPPEMAVQVSVPVTPPPSPATPSRQTKLPEMPTEKAVNDNNVDKEAKEEESEERQKEEAPVQKETPKQKRRNGGRSKNGNKQPSPPAKATVSLEKVPESEPVSVYIEKTEALEPVLSISNSIELESKALDSPVPAPVAEKIDNVPAPKEEVHVEPPSMEKKIEMEMFRVISPLAPDLPGKKEDLQNSAPKIIPEQKAEPPKTLDLDSFTFKPEPYKHPMLKPSKQEKKEEPILSEDNTVPKEVNGERTKAEETDKKLTEEEPSLSRHLEDMPRRRTRLKEPPEKEDTTGTQVPSSSEVVGKTPEQEVKNIISLEDERKGGIDDKPLGSEGLQAEVVEPAGVEDSETPAETLTEVVSKWLEENSDALPETTEEMTEKTEEEKKAEEEDLTGSKNGVGNPFPAPSSRLSEEVTSNESVNVAERECMSDVCASAISRDGPVKRVANRKIGKVQGNKDKYDDEGGRQSEESDESCEWEPMTVEAPKKNFGDLETWKRLRGGMGGSSEAIRSLGSYRGTDDEEEEERRKSMCDPSASVAKYYCLGGSREAKSASPEEGPARCEVPVPTDSGVQSDAEDDSVATAEEALEESTAKGKTAHRGVGLGKTAAFVVRQIGTADAAKGPFPCGICCIIQ